MPGRAHEAAGALDDEAPGDRTLRSVNEMLDYETLDYETLGKRDAW